MSRGLTLLGDDGPERHGTTVAAWATQELLARLLAITPRQVRKLEGVGLPCDGRAEDEGDGRELRYPLPHCVAWFWAYRDLTGRGEVVGHLDPEAALEIHRAWARETEARFEGRIRTRPSRR